MTVIATAEPSMVVLIPCSNEGATIGVAIDDFRRALLGTTICVCDNNSTGRTWEVGLRPGASVRGEVLPDKESVLRCMFADSNAGFYVMVDEYDMYDANGGPRLVAAPLENALDMVVQTRLADHESATFRRENRLGNQLLNRSKVMLFGRTLTDMLSSYRVFSRRFVQIFPALAVGFIREVHIHVNKAMARMIFPLPIPTRRVHIPTSHKLRGPGPCFQIS